MTGLIATLCFAIGLCVGAVLFRQFKSDAAKVNLLEEKLKALQAEHEDYKNNVHSHFGTTAQLANNLTDSYRELYRQLASGAQSLCPESISNQLSLSAQAYDLLSANDESGSADESSTDPLFPPRDYATKVTPDQKGNLSEDYGLDKVSEEPHE
ncbi:YhcB family protein [Gammaproteobacteria bacterium]|nr:YhcB family protein [Gammaproteobacteria bacterium]